MWRQAQGWGQVRVGGVSSINEKKRSVPFPGPKVVTYLRNPDMLFCSFFNYHIYKKYFIFWTEGVQ